MDLFDASNILFWLLLLCNILWNQVNKWNEKQMGFVFLLKNGLLGLFCVSIWMLGLFYLLNLAMIFLGMTPKSQATKTKINIWYYIKLKSFCTAKEIINKPTEWEKIFIRHISYNESVQQIYKKLKQLNSKIIIITTQLKHRQLTESVFLQRRHSNGYMKKSLTVQDMWIKTTIRYQLTPTREVDLTYERLLLTGWGEKSVPVHYR